MNGGQEVPGLGEQAVRVEVVCPIPGWGGDQSGPVSAMPRAVLRVPGSSPEGNPVSVQELSLCWSPEARRKLLEGGLRSQVGCDWI